MFALPEKSVHSSVLHCSWRTWRVTGETSLAVDLDEDNCTDMRGAIGIACMLMPEVELIETFAAGRPDTIYRKLPPGWVALDAAR